MSKEKDRFSCSLPVNVINSITDISAKKGQTISYVATKYMIDGLKNEVVLTNAERYIWSMTRINETIDRLLKIAKIHQFNGNIKESMLLLSSLLILNKGYFDSITAYNKFRYSFFEVLDEVSTIDKPLIDEISSILIEIQTKLKSSDNSEGLILFGNFRISEEPCINIDNTTPTKEILEKEELEEHINV